MLDGENRQELLIEHLVFSRHWAINTIKQKKKYEFKEPGMLQAPTFNVLFLSLSISLLYSQQSNDIVISVNGFQRRQFAKVEQQEKGYS